MLPSTRSTRAVWPPKRPRVMPAWVLRKVIPTLRAQRQLRDKFNAQQETLDTLAADTGGKAMLDSNDLATGIVQAQQSFSSYYILGYYSSSPADGRYRRVEVKLKSPEKYKLEYRAGYYAPKTFDKYTSTDKERQLEEALASEIRSPACRWRSRSTGSAAPRTATSFR